MTTDYPIDFELLKQFLKDDADKYDCVELDYDDGTQGVAILDGYGYVIKLYANGKWEVNKNGTR